jgi:hypothetical protein
MRPVSAEIAPQSVVGGIIALFRGAARVQRAASRFMQQFEADRHLWAGLYAELQTALRVDLPLEAFREHLVTNNLTLDEMNDGLRRIGIEQASADHRLAFWHVFAKRDSPERSRILSVEQPLTYLGTAVKCEARRTKRDREQGDRMRERLSGELEADVSTVDLETIASRRQQSGRMVNILREIRQTLPPKQRALVDALRGGLPPAEACRKVGATMSDYQGLQRKCRRRLARRAA